MIPINISVAPGGDIFVSERSAKRIRRIDAVTGVLTTAAGIGPATIGDGGSPALETVFEDIGNLAFIRSDRKRDAPIFPTNPIGPMIRAEQTLIFRLNNRCF